MANGHLVNIPELFTFVDCFVNFGISGGPRGLASEKNVERNAKTHLNRRESADSGSQ